MTKPVDYSFYSQVMYPKVRELVDTEISQTSARHLIETALRLGHWLEYSQPTFPNGTGAFLRLILTRMSQELYALDATIRAGSIIGSAHHARSLVETFAMVNYVGSTKSKRVKRLAKFSEFRLLAMYQFHQRLKNQLSNGEIAEEEFTKKNIIKPADIALFTESRTRKWLKLYKPINGDLLKIHNWHSPARIEALIEATHLKSNLKEMYGHLCHLTHISPLSWGVTANALLMQQDQLHQMENLAVISLVCFWHTIGIIDEWAGTRLQEREFFKLGKELGSSFARSSFRTKPNTK